MRVIVPFVERRLHKRVVPAITAQGYVAWLYRCDPPPEPGSYPGVLRYWLRSGEDFCVVEQDVESLPGTLDELADCPEPWCWNAYPLQVPFDETGLHLRHFAMLGHTRFRSSLLPELPGLDTQRWWADWDGRDRLLVLWLNSLGIAPHRHYPDVRHHHRYWVNSVSEES